MIKTISAQKLLRSFLLIFAALASLILSMFLILKLSSPTFAQQGGQLIYNPQNGQGITIQQFCAGKSGPQQIWTCVQYSTNPPQSSHPYCGSNPGITKYCSGTPGQPIRCNLTFNGQPQFYQPFVTSITCPTVTQSSNPGTNPSGPGNPIYSCNAGVCGQCGTTNFPQGCSGKTTYTTQAACSSACSTGTITASFQGCDGNNARFNVSWTASSGDFEIHRSNVGSAIKTNAGTSGSMQDSFATNVNVPSVFYSIVKNGAPMQQTADFNVSSCFPRSTPTPTPTATPTPTPTPTPPAEVTQNVPSSGCSGNSPFVSLSWSGGNGATSFRVFKGRVVAPVATLNSNVTTFMDTTTVSNNERYTYLIEAVNSAGTTRSQEVEISTQNCAPTPPSQVVLNNPTAGCNNNAPFVELSWDGGNGATNYRISRNGMQPVTLGPTVKSYRDSSVQNSQGYGYTVEAINNVGTISSGEKTVNTQNCAPPPPPLVGTCQATPASARVGQNVTWSVNITSGGPITQLTWDGDDPVRQIGDNLNTSQTVQYQGAGNKAARVRARNSVTNQETTINCNMVAISENAPLAPTLSATPDCEGDRPVVKLRWNKPSGASAFTVYRNNSVIANRGDDAYNDESAARTTTYSYHVTAGGAGGISPNSNVVSATTLDCRAVCAGYPKQCTAPGGQPGTQWCTPGLMVNGQCSADTRSTTTTRCYLEEGSNVEGCKPLVVTGACTSLSPQGLQNLNIIGPGGAQTYGVSVSQGETRRVPINLTRNPANAAIERPSARSETQNAPAISFEQANDGSGNWLMVVPDNPSTTIDHVYTVTTNVIPSGGSTNNPGACAPFILKLAKRPLNAACPTDINLTQGRFRKVVGTQPVTSDPWETQKTITVDSIVQIGGFVNNQTNAPVANVMLSITGPEGPASSTNDLYLANGSQNPNAIFFTPTLPGRYTLTARYRTTDGAIAVGNNCTSTSSLTVNPKEVFTRSFKVSDTDTGLAGAPSQTYTQAPTVVKAPIANTNPGTKNVWVEFIASDGTNTTTKKETLSIRYVGPDPTIKEVTCGLDLNGGLTIAVKGENFGDSKGTLSVDSVNVEDPKWSTTDLSGSLANAPAGSQNAAQPQRKIKVTRSDGQFVESLCQVGSSQISLGANIFCREPSKKSQNNVQLIIAGTTPGEIARETVTINQDGVVQGLRTRLQAGKTYKLAIKAPKSVRRATDFTASGGTTVIKDKDGADFVLPVGDIFPLDGGDGRINTADRAELNREWVTLSSIPNRPGDLNQDGKVNSVDWACMRYDFNESSDPEPVPGPISSPAPSGSSPSPSPSASPSTSPLTSPSASPLTSPTASPAT